MQDPKTRILIRYVIKVRLAHLVLLLLGPEGGVGGAQLRAVPAGCKRVLRRRRAYAATRACAVAAALEQ